MFFVFNETGYAAISICYSVFAASGEGFLYLLGKAPEPQRKSTQAVLDWSIVLKEGFWVGGKGNATRRILPESG